MSTAADLVSALIDRPSLKVEVGSGDALDVREFEVHEGLSELFTVDLTVVSGNPDLDFAPIIGRAGRFAIDRGLLGMGRVWSGVVNHIEQAEAVDEIGGLSTYVLRIVPEMWLLTQRRNYRVFQQMTDPAIAIEVLSDWGLDPVQNLAEYKERRYRVQYAESDFNFVARMLEDAGVTFFFETGDKGESRLILYDRPERAEARAPLPFVAQPNMTLPYDFVTKVNVTRNLRPGRYVQQDLDYRKPPTAPLSATARLGNDVEGRLERYHYNPGAFLYKAGGGDTPIADDRGAQRTDLGEGSSQVQKRLEAKRGLARRITFATSAIDMRPGIVTSFANHPRSDLAVDQKMLVVRSTFKGTSNGGFEHHCDAQFIDIPYRPTLRAEKPVTNGVESATVVGPAGEEIHTDEFGRIRVHFHWDRTGPSDERSSCWVPVSQPWGGTGFGALSIPRIGQEVLVDFLSADPDKPIVMGRVFTQTQPVPYKLPDLKMVTGLRSESTPALPPGTERSGSIGGQFAGGGAVIAGVMGAMSSLLGFGKPFDLGQIASKLLGNSPFNAAPPDKQTQGRSGSEYTMNDTQGQETTYEQVQKDKHQVVKNQYKSVIGNSRATNIGTDDRIDIENRNLVNVGQKRDVNIGDTQAHTVKNDITQQSLTANQAFTTAETFSSQAKNTTFTTDQAWQSIALLTHTISSGQRTTIKTGEKSVIVIDPDFIMIQSTDVYINPGQDIAEAVMYCGMSPKEAQEAKDKAAASARADAIKAASPAALQTARDAYPTGPYEQNPRYDLHQQYFASELRKQFPDLTYQEGLDAFNAANTANPLPAPLQMPEVQTIWQRWGWTE